MKVRVIFAALLAVLAAFFRFALIGYAFTAYACAGVAAVLLLYELCERQGWHIPRLVLTIALCLGFVCFLIAEIPVIRASHGDADNGADYLIVLGAGVHGSVPSLSMLDRLEAALEYLNVHPDCVAVVSGGQGTGETITEAEAMRVWLSRQGVAAERIVLEDKATTTAENLRYSFDIIRDRERDIAETSIAVVSSEYHLYRAQTMARRLGVPVSGVAGRTSLPVLRANYFLREAFAVWYLWVFGM